MSFHSVFFQKYLTIESSPISNKIQNFGFLLYGLWIYKQGVKTQFVELWKTVPLEIVGKPNKKKTHPDADGFL